MLDTNPKGSFVGPISLTAKVHCVSKKHRQFAEVEISLPPGRQVTVESLHRAVGRALAALGEDFRLMDAEEYFNQVVVRAKTGRAGKFAAPDSMWFDAGELTEAGRAALAGESKDD
jgi:translation elongation factor P/translation initiation factor 5A